MIFGGRRMTTSESSIRFLIKKFRDYSFKDLFRLQLESFFLWLFEGAPGLPGFVLRNVVFRAFFREIHGFAWVQPRVTFVHTDRLSVGPMFGVNSGTYINAVGGIRIGSHVLIGSNVTISSGKHPIEGCFPPVFSRPSIPIPIVIEDDVWIGAGAVIVPGVTLKKGTVVGANSVVTRDTEEYSVVVGSPAKLIRKRI